MARFMPEEWPLPGVTKYNRDFFTSGKVMVQQCASCQTLQHPPEDCCWKCQSFDFNSVEMDGNGTIYSYEVVHNPPAPSLKDRVPYAVVLVSLDQQPEIRMLGNVVNAPHTDVAIGKKVRATFEEIPDPEGGETLQLLQWELV